MASILPFDELNRFKTRITEWYANNPQLKQKDEEDIIDELLDLFLLAYAQGNQVTIENLAYLTDGVPSDFKPDVDDVMKVVDERVANKTWRERIKEYFDKARKGELPTQSDRGETEEQSGNGNVSLPDAIIRIAETETHRIANTAAITSAKKAGAKTKTWATMLDDKVRETHDYLEGMTVNIDEDFYTYDGDHASAPGLFELAQNNINCRCELIFS